MDEAAPPRSIGAVDAAVAWDGQFDAVLREVLVAVPDDQPVYPDTDLVAAGLDSAGIVLLIALIEDAYDIVLPDEALSAETFTTPAALWREVAKLRGEPPHGAG